MESSPSSFVVSSSVGEGVPVFLLTGFFHVIQEISLPSPSSSTSSGPSFQALACLISPTLCTLALLCSAIGLSRGLKCTLVLSLPLPPLPPPLPRSSPLTPACLGGGMMNWCLLRTSCRIWQAPPASPPSLGQASAAPQRTVTRPLHTNALTCSQGCQRLSRGRHLQWWRCGCGLHCS